MLWHEEEPKGTAVGQSSSDAFGRGLKKDSKRGARVAFRFDFEAGVVVVEDGGDEREAQAHSGGIAFIVRVVALGGKVRLQAAGANLIAHADAVVADFENSQAAGLRVGM